MAESIDNRIKPLAVLDGREDTHLLISEIFDSIQGESTQAGRRCIFVRLAVCNLRCGYCDTAYAFTGGEVLSVADVVSTVKSYGCKLVEITGGEPLLQCGVVQLARDLLADGFEVMIETGGSLDISVLPERVKRILDIKTPGSGEVEANLLANLKQLRAGDELKFVVTSKQDFDWALGFIKQHELQNRVPLLISPCQPQVSAADCVSWIRECDIDLRLNLQLHKIVWSASKRGV